MTWLDLILLLFFICCGCPSSWGRQQATSTFNTSHSDCDVKFYKTACPSCHLNSTFTVSKKPPFPHLGFAPVTRLKCYCHLGCDRLFEIAINKSYKSRGSAYYRDVNNIWLVQSLRKVLTGFEPTKCCSYPENMHLSSIHFLINKRWTANTFVAFLGPIALKSFGGYQNLTGS